MLGGFCGVRLIWHPIAVRRGISGGYAVLLLVKDHTEDFMMFCDVDGGVIYRDSWSRVRGFFKAKSAKAYANGLVG
jgi:hypothetical protein